jgi:signal transduction histidine kinase
LIIRLAQSWSIAVSMVVLVLIPTLATFAGVLGASGFMITQTFEQIAVVLVIVAVVTLPAGIRAVSEAIADGLVADDEIRPHAEHIEQESIRLFEMVDDLFEMSKINAGAVQLSYDKVALDEVVDDALAAHRIAAERVSNLVANAIAHTPEGGTVELALGADEHGAFARIDDTGVGIDEADLPRVFDVAYRGSNGRVPRSAPSLPSGSGLGPAIAAGLVQAHHGTLSAHNLGTGARFEVRLPLATDD